MDEKIRDAFGEIRMRENFAQALELQLEQEQLMQTTLRRARRKRYAAIAAVLALATVLLAVNPNVVSAVENTVQSITGKAPSHRRLLKNEILYLDEAVKVKQLKEDSSIQAELPVRVHPWLRVMDGRLYYVDYRDDRVRVDLTDQLSEEDPVYIQFVDDYGLCHYLAIAGSYHGEETVPESVWFLELLWNPEKVRQELGINPEENPYVSGGYEDMISEGEIMRNSGERLPWFEKAKAYYSCPWN